MFPIYTYKLTKEQADIFNKYFAEEGKFHFEGCWFRNQRPENAKASNYIDETTVRRRYIHYYDAYKTLESNGDYYLVVDETYMYVSNTLPQNEIDAYLNKILNELQTKCYKFDGNETYSKGNLEVIIKKYKNHPKNSHEFPNNYSSVDIIIRTKGNDYSSAYERMWRLSTKIFRKPEKRGNPTYISDVNEILKFFPAQVEMGCGPSISTNIPPLYEMHETYKVQNHITKSFYFAEQDDLILSIIQNPIAMYTKFAKVPFLCISAKLTDGYKSFGDLYKKGYFKGIVFNNNFDRLVKRMDIPEKILRIYDLDDYIAHCEFDANVKSLICMGCHADRRQVQRQARALGLKVIYIDPEGFYEKEGFVSYAIEGPKDEDLIWKTTFETAMEELAKKLP